MLRTRFFEPELNVNVNVNDFETQTLVDCSDKRFIFGVLIFAQIVLVLFLLFSNKLHPGLFPWTLSMFGLALGVWAVSTMGRFPNISPCPKSDATLQTSGPYRLIRHPMYAALLLYCGALLIGDVNGTRLGLWLALFFVLAVKVYYEEQILHARFPEYETYSKRTKLIVPFVF